MLFLHKLLPLFVLPLGVVLTLLAVGLLRRRHWLVVAALAILYASSTPLLGFSLMRSLEYRYLPVAPSAAPQADAIVPLSGMLGPEVPTGYVPNLGDGIDRLEGGVALWREHKAKWLVFTGGRIPWAKQTELEGSVCRRLAIERGVEAQQIQITAEAGSTAEEAVAVKALMQEQGWHRILLVTSALHLPRAVRIFRKAGIELEPFPVDYHFRRDASMTLLDLLPSAQGLLATETVLREWYGIAFYAVFG